MSGTAGDLGIKIGIDGVPQMEAAFSQLEARLGTAAAAQRQFEQSSLLARQAFDAGVISQDRYTQALGAAQAKLDQQNRTVETASGSMGRFNQIIQQGGYQAGDLAVQIQGGTNALVALSQQGSQFLGMFGPAGAVAGVILTVGTIAANFLLTANNAEQAKSKGQEALDAMAKSGADTARVLREINDLFLTAGQRAANLANMQRAELRSRNESRLAEVGGGRAELARRLAEEEQYLSDIARPSGNLYRAESNADRAREAEAIIRVRELRSQLAAADREAEQLRQGLLRLDKAGLQGAEEFGPTSADPFGTNALRASLDRRFAAQQQYAERINQINLQVREGTLSAAEGERLATLAVRERDEAIQKLGETVKAVARNMVEVQDMDGGVFSRDANVQRRLDEWRAKAAREQEQAEQKGARAREKSERDYEAALERRQNEEARTTDDIVRYTADSFADMFAETELSWGRMWQNMRRTAASLGARIAAEAVIRPIVAPIVGGMMGGMGGASNALAMSAINNAPGGVDYTSLVRNAGGGLTSFGGGGSYFSGAANWLDATAASYAPSLFASTNVAAPSTLGFAGAAGTPITTAQIDALSASMPATPGGGAFFGSASGTAMGALGVAGGLYGIYSGVQTGGARGWAQGAGGAAGVVGGLGTLASAGGAVGGMLGGASGALAALGPYGLAAAAVLAIASQFLPGQKPSNREGNATVDLLSGGLSIAGQTGGKFSAENRDAAQGIASSISDIAASLRAATGVGQTPYAFTVGVGDRDGIYLRDAGAKQQFSRDEAGSQALIQAATSQILTSMRAAFSENVSTVVDASGGDLQRTLENLGWLRNIYEPMQRVATVADQFAAAVAATRAPFDEAIAKARTLGLEVNVLSQRQAEAVTKLYEARAANDRDMFTGFDVRFRRAAGMDQDAALMEFNAATDREWRSLVEGLQSQGYTDSEIADRTRYFENVQAQERLAIIRQFGQEAVAAEQQAANDRLRASQQAAGVVQSLADYARSLGAGDMSPYSLQDRFGSAQRNFDSIFQSAMGGDAASLRQYQGASQEYLSLARDLYGSTGGYVDAFNRVQNGLGAIGNVGADTLTASFQAEIVQDQTVTLVNALAQVQAEVAALRREQAQANLRQAA